MNDLKRKLLAEKAEIDAEIDARLAAVRKEPRMRTLAARRKTVIRLIDRETMKALDRLHAERIKAGTCSHCGGPCPCSSIFGDIRPGVRRP